MTTLNRSQRMSSLLLLSSTGLTKDLFGKSFGLNEGLQSENPQWYIALANAIQPWINNGFDVNYAQLGGLVIMGAVRNHNRYL